MVLARHKGSGNPRFRDIGVDQLQHLFRYRQEQARRGHHESALGSERSQSGCECSRGGDQRLPGQQDWQAPMIRSGARRAQSEEGGRGAERLERDVDG